MEKMYMVRAGEKSTYYNEFYGNNYVAIGWNSLGNIAEVKKLSELKELLEKAYPDYNKQKLGLNAGQVNKFLLEMKMGDYIVTYNSEERKYSLGKITSEYKYDQNLNYKHIRDVIWECTFSRDILTNTSKYSLGALTTVFEIPDDVKKEILSKTNNKDIISNNSTEQDQKDGSLEIITEDFEDKAHEFIKDKISQFDWEKMQELVAALVRSLGFKTKVSPKGSDRGKDIIASPDGLELLDPRIKIEVKHRQGQMGTQEIRSFLGGFRTGSRGLYVSTGGFSKEAKYEAERADHPITLIDLDYLVDLIITNYDNFDIEGKAILPLKKIYWPI